MLAVLKVSSLACKCAFYRPQHNAKKGPDGIELKVWKCRNEICQQINGQSSKSG